VSLSHTFFFASERLDARYSVVVKPIRHDDVHEMAFLVEQIRHAGDALNLRYFPES
jgi:hypothetical protein